MAPFHYFWIPDSRLIYCRAPAPLPAPVLLEIPPSPGFPSGARVELPARHLEACLDAPPDGPFAITATLSGEDPQVVEFDAGLVSSPASESWSDLYSAWPGDRTEPVSWLASDPAAPAPSGFLDPLRDQRCPYYQHVVSARTDGRKPRCGPALVSWHELTIPTLDIEFGVTTNRHRSPSSLVITLSSTDLPHSLLPVALRTSHVNVPHIHQEVLEIRPHSPRLHRVSLREAAEFALVPPIAAQFRVRGIGSAVTDRPGATFRPASGTALHPLADRAHDRLTALHACEPAHLRHLYEPLLRHHRIEGLPANALAPTAEFLLRCPGAASRIQPTPDLMNLPLSAHPLLRRPPQTSAEPTADHPDPLPARPRTRRQRIILNAQSQDDA